MREATCARIQTSKLPTASWTSGYLLCGIGHDIGGMRIFMRRGVKIEVGGECVVKKIRSCELLEGHFFHLAIPNYSPR